MRSLIAVCALIGAQFGLLLLHVKPFYIVPLSAGLLLIQLWFAKDPPVATVPAQTWIMILTGVVSVAIGIVFGTAAAMGVLFVALLGVTIYAVVRECRLHA